MYIRLSVARPTRSPGLRLLEQRKGRWSAPASLTLTAWLRKLQKRDRWHSGIGFLIFSPSFPKVLNAMPLRTLTAMLLRSSASGREGKEGSVHDTSFSPTSLGYIILPKQSVLHNPIKVTFLPPTADGSSPTKKRSASTSCLSALGTAEEVTRCGLIRGLNVLKQGAMGSEGSSIVLTSDCFDSDNEEDDVILFSIREIKEGSCKPYNAYQSHLYHATISVEGSETKELKSGDFFSIGEVEGRIFSPCVLAQEASIATSAFYQPTCAMFDDLRGHRPHSWESTDTAEGDSSNHGPPSKRLSMSERKDSPSDMHMYIAQASGLCGEQMRGQDERQSWEPRYSDDGMRSSFGEEVADESFVPPLTLPSPALPLPPLPPPELAAGGGSVFTWVASRRIAEGGVFDAFERVKMMRSPGFTFMVPLHSEPSPRPPTTSSGLKEHPWEQASFDDALGLLQLSPEQ